MIELEQLQRVATQHDYSMDIVMDELMLNYFIELRNGFVYSIRANHQCKLKTSQKKEIKRFIYKQFSADI